MNKQKLQDYIADFFPVEYNVKTWKTLLPKFITHHIALYHSRVEGYRKDLERWHQSDKSTPMPTTPVMPVEFVEASAEQARLEDLNFDMMACTMYIARERANYFQEQSKKDNGLCGEAIQAAMELRQAYLTLEEKYLKLKEGGFSMN